jgi:hypothetical protein
MLSGLVPHDLVVVLVPAATLYFWYFYLIFILTF